MTEPVYFESQRDRNIRNLEIFIDHLKEDLPMGPQSPLDEARGLKVRTIGETRLLAAIGKGILDNPSNNPYRRLDRT